MPSNRSRPTLHERFSVAYLRAAKLRRDRFSGGAKDYYEGYFSDAHVVRYKNDFLMQLRRQEIVAALGALPKGASVADIGCGGGDVLEALPSGLRPMGVDYSVHSLQLCRRNIRSTDATFTNASVYSLPFVSDCLDAVICLEVLEHLEDDIGAALEIARILRPGGLLVVSVPGSYYFSDYLQLTGHYRHYTQASLRDLLEKAGLHLDRPLQHYPRLNAVYLYVYALLAGLNLLGRIAFSNQRTLYDRRLPIVGVPLYSIFSNFILRPFAEKEYRSDSGTLPSATFQLARKPRS